MGAGPEEPQALNCKRPWETEGDGGGAEALAMRPAVWVLISAGPDSMKLNPG